MIAKMLDTLSPVEFINNVYWQIKCVWMSLGLRRSYGSMVSLKSSVFVLLTVFANEAVAGKGYVLSEDDMGNIDSVCVNYFPAGINDNRTAVDRCTSVASACIIEQNDKGRTVDTGFCVTRGRMAGEEVLASQRQNAGTKGAAATSPQSSSPQTKTSSDPNYRGEEDPRLAACVQTTENAKNFCKDPLKYSSDGEINIGSRDNAVMATNLMMVGGMVGTSNKGICEFMKKGGTGITGLNATFAARCSSFINDCETACEEGRKPAGDGNDQLRANFADIKLRTCRAQRDRAAEMTGSAMQSLYAAQAGKLCSEALDKPKIAGLGPPPEFAPGGTNCATDPSNPICAGGNNSNVGSGPNYGGGAGGNGGAGNAVDGSSGPGGGANGFNVDGVEGAAGQVGPRGTGSGTENKNGGVPNGGGGMVGGGGSGGGGGGDDRPGRGGGGSGVSANVLQGERGGGGYSVSPGGGFASSGGWSGYGNGSESNQRGSGFDLSKFLPGQSNPPMRGPAGLNRAGVEVAPMHEDIFQKISDRVRVVCKTNRLRDCN